MKAKKILTNDNFSYISPILKPIVFYGVKIVA
ncbi:MAG: hypothetical protein H6Q21_2215 [Bacteroidetes bacterium]|nr:hypothetical protein [Bacteroidota bacterium]